ncbi:ABC transporter substrate-binding protein [Altererythrobacter sp. ZODW24]|uniref:ABC transporter substrate-binding protein n=1 Tax=Altererythrobacter sp. ZODW24 TaxID=2185142 RepID=UPI000DF7F28C|nr:ABC transporter substrate-binding protein [Altererythrobacter sp. ZODW24]
MPFRSSIILTFLATLLLSLSGCDNSRDDGVVDAVIIGSPDGMYAPGYRLAASGQLLRGATAEGLVGLNAAGEVVPALADRWIVTDDGQSYIFRLRNGEWANGTPLTGESVRASLDRNLRELQGTSLGLDLSPISEVRAMTGRVVEIRLEAPVPGLLQLLAQPELGLQRDAEGTGPMALERDEAAAVLTMLPPDRRGLPMIEGWDKTIRPVRVQAMAAPAAIEQFDSGAADIVLNGRVNSLSLADTGALSRGTVRLDAALGLFGLRVNKSRGFLADAGRREALSLAIDRPSLVAPFNIGGWVPTTRIVDPTLSGSLDSSQERWPDLSLEQRRATASARVALWKAANGGDAPRLTIAMPTGPGSGILFRQIRASLSSVGIASELVGPDADADLELVDRLARFDSPRWFLNQFNCSLKQGLCSADADALVLDAISPGGPGERADLLLQAEREMLASNVYIPFGAPIRWSLVRGDVEGFATNRWGLHPLPPLAMGPI